MIKKLFRLLPLFLLILLIIVAYPRISELSPDKITRWSAGSMLLSILLLLGLYCLKAVTVLLPVGILYMAAGLMFPTGMAILITYVGLFADISIGYIVGVRLGHKKVLELMQKSRKAEHFFTTQQENSVLTCFVARILPFPFDLVSMFFGAVKMTFPKYVLFSLLGLSPFMISFILAGGNLTNPLSLDFLLPFLFCFLLSCTTSLVFLLYKRRQ